MSLYWFNLLRHYVRTYVQACQSRFVCYSKWIHAYILLNGIVPTLLVMLSVGKTFIWNVWNLVGINVLSESSCSVCKHKDVCDRQWFVWKLWVWIIWEFIFVWHGDIHTSHHYSERCIHPGHHIYKNVRFCVKLNVKSMILNLSLMQQFHWLILVDWHSNLIRTLVYLWVHNCSSHGNSVMIG